MVIIVFGAGVRNSDRGLWRMHRPESRRECQLHSRLLHGTSRRRYNDNGSVCARLYGWVCMCVWVGGYVGVSVCLCIAMCL